MANIKTKEHATKAIKEIMAEVNNGVVKDYEILTLCNLETCEETGFAVTLILSTKFDYTSNILNMWSAKFEADNYMISVERNKLKVRFNVRYN